MHMQKIWEEMGGEQKIELPRRNDLKSNNAGIIRLRIFMILDLKAQVIINIIFIILVLQRCRKLLKNTEFLGVCDKVRGNLHR